MTPREVMARALCKEHWLTPCDPEGCKGDPAQCTWHAKSDAILSALAAAGYAVVPVEPTREMVTAGEEAVTSCAKCHKEAWRAMLAAAKEQQG